MLTCDLSPDRLSLLQAKVLAPAKAQTMANFFSLLGDPSRLRILSALAIQELCVHDLAQLVGMSASAVSHQLRVLRNLRLVSARRDKRKIYYQLLDRHVVELYKAVDEHLDEEADNDPC
jgi:DNA-binding transcriptional ArsR family regulator